MLFIWAGLWIELEVLDVILTVPFIANSALATLLLLMILLLGRYIIRLQQQQTFIQQQLEFTANRTKSGYWQLNKHG